jgi:hypothetical protein
MFSCIRRIEKQISNCVVERVSLRKTRDEKIYRRSIEWSSCKVDSKRKSSTSSSCGKFPRERKSFGILITYKRTKRCWNNIISE